LLREGGDLLVGAVGEVALEFSDLAHDGFVVHSEELQTGTEVYVKDF
jgi:hypothetical protein